MPTNSSTSPFKKNLRRVILTTLVFCLSFLLLDRLLAWVLVSFCQQWQPSHSRNILTEDILHADIMIIGSSRAYNAFDPEIMAKQTGMTVRQEAWKGKYIRYHYHFYQQYRKISKAPKILIWGLDYFLFAHGTDRPYLQRLGLEEPSPKAHPSQADQYKRPAGPFSKISHLVRNRALIQGTFYDILNLYNQEDQPSGPRKYRNSDRHIQAEIEPVQYIKYPYHTFPGQESQYLDDFLKLLIQDGVQIYLVILPDYLGTQLSHADEATYTREWTEIAARYPSISLLNFNTEKTYGISRSHLFFDGGYGKISSHLNRFGAAILSKKVAGILKNHRTK
jgi:hypothetical protein